MTLRPLHDRIVVKRFKEKTTSTGGIVLVGEATEESSKGTVMAAGKGKQLDSGEILPMSVKPGDVILYGTNTGNEVSVNGERLTVMREEDIMGILSSN